MLGELLFYDKLNILKTSKAFKGYERSYSVDGEYTLAYFSSTTKTVIGLKFGLGKSLEEVFNRINNWISEGSGWIIESIDA